MFGFWPLLIAVLSIISVFALLKGRVGETRELFLVANRRVGYVLGIIAITSVWTQVPALFASGMYAYKSTLHFFLFWIPNVLALIVPVYVVISMRKVLPSGYTGPQYLGTVYGPFLRSVGFCVQLVTLIALVANTLIGIAQWLGPLLNISQWVLAGAFGMFAFCWVLFSGLPGALVGDRIKVFSILLLVAGIAYLWWHVSGDITWVTPQRNSAESVGDIVWKTGVLLAVSLIGGALCNPDVGERNFALVNDPRVLRRVYWGSAALFALITLAFGSLGLLASQTMNGTFTGFPAFAILKKYASQDSIVIASVCISVILTSALAGYIASAGDLVGIEGFQRMYRGLKGAEPSDKQIVWASRLMMPCVMAIAMSLAMMPDISIPKVLESLAVLRGEVIFPMLAAPWLLRYGVQSRRFDVPLALGMIVGLIGGVFLTYSGDILGKDAAFLIANGKPLGALFALFMPAVFFGVWTLLSPKGSVQRVTA